MYLSVIGKRLVSCVNQRDGTHYDIREFFDEIFTPLFFGSQRFLLFVNNSPFDQAVGKQKKSMTPELLKACTNEIHRKVADLTPDASFFLGGAASGSLETTSGQVTNLKLPIYEEEILASWIGAACGVMVQGGITLAIDNQDVLLVIFEGWRTYRKYIDQTPSMKPLKVNAWNGQWLTHKMSENSEYTFIPTPTSSGEALETQGWVQLLFSLSYFHRDKPLQQIIAYVYSLGQSNSTFGFIRLNLSEVRRPVDLYSQLFTVPEGMPPKKFETLYDTELTFRRACETTEIGLKSIKPKDTYKGQYGIPKAPNATDVEKRLVFDTYQTWIIAMLNNKDFLQRAEELASAFLQFSSRGNRGKTVNNQVIEEALKSRYRREFIDNLTSIVEQDKEHCELYKQIVKELLNLSQENVTLFLTLLRFQYAAAASVKR